MSDTENVEEEVEKTMKAPKSKKANGRLRKEAEDYMDNIAKRGVIYLSRVPPFMKPNKARNIFEQYGEVTRLYLAEEGTGVTDSSTADHCVTFMCF